MLIFSSQEGCRLWFDQAHYAQVATGEKAADFELALSRRGIRVDSEHSLRSTIPQSRGSADLYGYGTPGVSAVQAAQLPSMRVLMIGTCLSQLGEAAFHAEGMERGYDAVVTQRWLGSDSSGADSGVYDMVIIQAGAQILLQPIFASRTERQLTRACSAVGRVIEGYVSSVRRDHPDATLVVHNIAKPATWPPVIASSTWNSSWDELNAEILVLTDDAGGVVLDEQAIAYEYGASRLFDDLQFPWSHHGGRTDLRRPEPNQLESVHAILAKEQWDAWETLAKSKIKYIVSDLDGVLWPGVLVEDEINWLTDDSNPVWQHLGLQEALSSLEQAGIVLVSLSRGDEDLTLREWNLAGAALKLKPEQFAFHSIDWSPKTARMKSIIEKLQTTESEILFLDDHPAERAAMMRSYPLMRVLGGNLLELRRDLLRHPSLRWLSRSEGTSRTETTRAAIQRENVVTQVAPENIRQYLEVSVEMRVARPEDQPRIDELVSRTTQFSLGNGYIPKLGTPLEIVVMSVADRFVDYGIVGVAAWDYEAQCLRSLSMSCRVISLEVHDDLVDVAFRLADRTTMDVDLRETPRNAVLRRVFGSWHLECRDGQYQIDKGGRQHEMDHAASAASTTD